MMHRRHTPGLRHAGLAAVFLALPLAARGAPATEPTAGITFNKDIAPIVFAQCAVCHRPGEAGPFDLLTYADVKAHARQIVKVTESRFMPPWAPEHGKGDFAGERRLTDEQITLFRRWVEGGAVEGDAADRPSAPRFPEGWPLGEPDLVLKTDRPFALRADGPDVFWNLVYRSPTPRTRYVRAVEIRMGDRKVAHHANLLVDRTRSSRRREVDGAGSGFPGMELAMESEGFEPESHFLFWKPGTIAQEEPKGMAWRLDPATDLVLNLHLRPSGKPEAVAPTIGLYFTDEAPSVFPMLVQLERDGALDVPPGRKDFVVTDEYELPVSVDLLAIYPHAHYLGKDVEGVATLPDGSRRWLIHVPDWDVNWQAVYRYTSPVALPRGTRITMRWSYDNTADNPRNPHHPPARVRAGNRAEDEMAHLWLQVLPRPERDGGKLSFDPRLLLQEALMRRRLAKYPDDFTGRYNLGAALQAQGRRAEAVRELREAVRLEPARATARNTLGAALQADGKVQEAAAEYREAVRLDPAYASARYNLGQLLVAAGNLDGALREFREAARQEPDDPELQAQLGAALLEKGDLDPSIDASRRALALDPDHARARYNLGQALARKGDLTGATEAFREAIRRRPDDPDPDARDALGAALYALGRTDEAQASFEDALARAPDDPGAHDALGQIALASGAMDAAAAHFRIVLRVRPRDADACNNLGTALAMKGDLAGAADAFERALAIDPGHAAARANLARARAASRPD
jgi:tetratricopeptide (TPR) repeat protein/mono/diheme cytochrome c family protein